ncbi:hypothetical protein SUGI_0462130 [Cryptomeria japonica]|uniref:CASP-like protein 4B1 n=1 Tax=Cryptomeria japonica TaxID=3369 RepID=UPI0024089970|nr:CASP-like protein 4B1 [Cryptomeria japonica]GLJ24235.1 hypothetical protein SUGI_0462130 [Cryptomeria japonica]
MAEVEVTKMGDFVEEGGSESHPHVYMNGGNSEKIASPLPMEAMVHKAIVVHEQEEELDVSNNVDHEVPPFPKEGPVTVKTTMSFLHERKEQRIRVTNLVLRGLGVLFSFISFVIMASDDQGSQDYISNDDDRSFDAFAAYRYCLAMGVIAFVYLVLQLGKGIYVTFFNPNSFRHVAFSYVDFIGDQILAYLLMSSSSSAASQTGTLERFDYFLSRRTIDLPAASSSMSFLAFASVAASSVLSSFALSKRILW